MSEKDAKSLKFPCFIRYIELARLMSKDPRSHELELRCVVYTHLRSDFKMLMLMDRLPLSDSKVDDLRTAMHLKND